MENFVVRCLWKREIQFVILWWKGDPIFSFANTWRFSSYLHTFGSPPPSFHPTLTATGSRRPPFLPPLSFCHLYVGLLGFGTSVFDLILQGGQGYVFLRAFLCVGFIVMNSAGITEGNKITFWQRLKKQRHGLGNMALAGSTLLLAMRLIDQDKEIQRLQSAESSLLNALRHENRSIQERFATFRVAVAEEIGRAGSR
jgi:hypothetical protein